MTGIRKNLWENLKDRVFRKAYREEHIKNGVAFQIRAMREARNWSQSELAKRAGKAQSAIARIEDPDYGKFSLQTLLEIADVFDVWLSVQFTSFSEGLRRTANLSPTALNVSSFELDRQFNVRVSHSISTNVSLREELFHLSRAVAPSPGAFSAKSGVPNPLRPINPNVPRPASQAALS